MGQFARVIIPPVRSCDAVQPLPRSTHLVRLHGQTMGTTWSASLYDASPGRALVIDAGIKAALAEVVVQMSPWEPASDLSRFNRAPAGTWHQLPPLFFTVLKTALTLARATGGAFDPTLGAAVGAWGFGPEGPRAQVPSPEEVATSAASSGWARIEIDRQRQAARQPGGIRLDLCGIAKGFAVDHVAEALKRLNLRDYLVEVGGELRGEGVKPDGSPWWVAIDRPPMDQLGDGEAGSVLDTVIALHGASIATSGDYRRFLESGGRRYPHTIDPNTARPVENALASVTVLHPSCMHADALATALTVMGPVRGMRHACGHGLAALFITRSKRGLATSLSPALARMLE
ncbi:MAG TPA: FAD:protein FMN transferase [Hyphomicrobiaceae bacterium]|nr:FAD:protein FMN transferase [Hyphomicrobiaceae bacterium]